MTHRSPQSVQRKLLSKLMREKFPYAMVHVTGCGLPAFYLMDQPAEDEALDPGKVCYPDGSMPAQGDEAKCGSCKANLTVLDLEPGFVRKVQ